MANAVPNSRIPLFHAAEERYSSRHSANDVAARECRDEIARDCNRLRVAGPGHAHGLRIAGAAPAQPRARSAARVSAARDRHPRTAEETGTKAGFSGGGVDAARGNPERLAGHRRAPLDDAARYAQEHGRIPPADSRLVERTGVPLRHRQRSELRRRGDLRRLALEAADSGSALCRRAGNVFRRAAARQLLQRARHRNLPCRQLRKLRPDRPADRRARTAHHLPLL